VNYFYAQNSNLSLEKRYPDILVRSIVPWVRTPDTPWLVLCHNGMDTLISTLMLHNQMRLH